MTENLKKTRSLIWSLFDPFQCKKSVG
jgi:hypothetical protein